MMTNRTTTWKCFGLSASVLALLGCEAEPVATTPTPPPSCTGQSGCITTVIGTGEDRAPTAEDTLAWQTPMSLPQDMLTGPDGNVYFLDWNNHMLRVMDSKSGKVRTVAGNGELGDDGHGGLATKARLNHPTGLDFAPDGAILMAAWHNSKVKRIDLKTGILTDVCGTGKRDYGGDGGPAPKAFLDLPSSVVVDGKGNTWIADQASQRIRVVDGTDTIRTAVGDRWVTDSGKKDGKPLVDEVGNYLNCKKIPVADKDGFALVAATEAGSDKTIYVRAKNPDGQEFKVPMVPIADKCGGYQDGPAASAAFNWQFSQSAIPNGRMHLRDDYLYFADTMNHRVRRLDVETMEVTTVAGNGTLGSAGDGGPALQAQLNTPIDVDTLPDGTVLIADTFNHCVRAVDKAGTIRTFAGVCGKKGFGGDGGPATAARLKSPYGIHVDPGGRVWIADTTNQRIRVVSP
jgi:sugar lactone lactonase YvrE